MNERKRNYKWIAVAISIAALLVSIGSAYWNLLRSVQLEVATARDMWVSNTVGGVPDAFFTLGFRGVGSPDNAVTIRRIDLSLTNETTGKTVNLEALRAVEGETFPIVIKGKESKSSQLLFQVNDYVPQRINRIESWCDEMLTALPESKREDVQRVRTNLKETIMGSSSDADEWSELDLAELLSEATRYDYSDDIVNLLEGEDSAVLERLLFITAGSYSAELTAYDPFDNILDQISLSFAVEPVLSEVLRNKFNTNTRVRVSIDAS
jgi:hypothetical protein